MFIGFVTAFATLDCEPHDHFHHDATKEAHKQCTYNLTEIDAFFFLLSFLLFIFLYVMSRTTTFASTPNNNKQMPKICMCARAVWISKLLFVLIITSSGCIQNKHYTSVFAINMPCTHLLFYVRDIIIYTEMDAFQAVLLRSNKLCYKENPV